MRKTKTDQTHRKSAQKSEVGSAPPKENVWEFMQMWIMGKSDGKRSMRPAIDPHAFFKAMSYFAGWFHGMYQRTPKKRRNRK